MPRFGQVCPGRVGQGPVWFGVPGFGWVWWAWVRCGMVGPGPVWLGEVWIYFLRRVGAGSGKAWSAEVRHGQVR